MMFTNPTTLLEEKVLIQKASNGSLDAFNQLVLKYQDLAYAHAYSLLGDPALAEDATQESFIKAYRSIKRFNGGSFKAWIMKIVTNTAYDMLRWSKRHPYQSLFPKDQYGEEYESADWLIDSAPSVQTTVEYNELSKNIYKLLNELPDRYRNVITLVDMHALEYNEVAEILGIPIGTVKSRLARARMQMRVKLEGDTAYPHMYPIAERIPVFS